MKRLRIWANSLSLLQQFLVIAFLVGVFFITFFFTIMPKSIDSFVNDQMHEYLHTSQDNLIANDLYYQDDDDADANVNNFIYSKTSKKYQNDLSLEESELLDNIDPDIDSEYYDGSFLYDGRTVVYSI